MWQPSSAVADEFGTTVVPTLASALEMDPATFNGFVGEQFPAVAGGVAALPDIAAQFTGVIDLMESQQANFTDADAIPTTSLPVTTVPWDDSPDRCRCSRGRSRDVHESEIRAQRLP